MSKLEVLTVLWVLVIVLVGGGIWITGSIVLIYIWLGLIVLGALTITGVLSTIYNKFKGGV